MSAFMGALVRLLVGLRLMLRTVVHLLIARREWLGIPRQIRLRLLHLRLRCIARFVLAHERLGIVIVAIKALVCGLLTRRSLLLRLLVVVIGILLTELFLRGGDQAKIMLGVLIVVFSGHRIARALCVTRKLDILFRNMRSSAADFDIGTV